MPPPIQLYNTMGRRKQVLQPILPGRVSIYTCGPTVYRYAHVGNLRTYLFADLLVRVLEYNGLEVRQVKNITDVGHLTDDNLDRGEDKMLLSARLEKKSPTEIAEYYTQAFREDEARLNIRPAAAFPKATAYVPQMIELISRLLDRGHAYENEGNVYYDISSFPNYGRLSNNTTDKLLAGTKGEADRRKRNPLDFSLWKSGARRAQVWDSPWGPGFPGWHIECSAMSLALLGERFDIHTGGADNVFPHHEAEIAQSEGVTGAPVVGCWVHGQHLFLGEARMAKSAGNFFRITELEEQGYDPLAFRYLALQARYRAPLHFSPDAMAGADRALRQLRERIVQWSKGSTGPTGDYPARFHAAINDDLDLPAVMALISELGHSELAPGAKAALLKDWDRVLGLDLDREATDGGLPEGAAALMTQRQTARAERDFATSDRLRDELAAVGVQVTDTPGGQSWRLVGPPKPGS
ncbi:MAG: cysteine--tRNA ligase [Candidatus Dormibacteraeota bacterium]|nr:cysteine--tRNA ligase [Candidatus Dormibacteraeota bacterium]